VAGYEQSGNFLRRLIPFPGTDVLTPLSPLSMAGLSSAAVPSPVNDVANPVTKQAASIASQAASILDEEMARGVVAARDATPAASYATIAPDTAHAPATAAPRYQWASEFLGAFTVQLINPPESFGPGPDGMHITYYIASGEIHGPKINGKVRGGDWMLLRHDGVGVAESRITYETDDGALLLSRYYGILDLGRDAYGRALRNEFDPVPPLVLAPQFITSHPKWLWLNRLQCLAVGRATMADLIVRLDIYAIRTGQPLSSSGLPRVDAPALIGDIH